MSAADEVQVRLFFAVVPDRLTRERLAAAASALQLDAVARHVPLANYHMTLAFVGAVPARHVTTLQQIASALRAASFDIRFDAYEYWPKPEVVVAAARIVPVELRQLWRALHDALALHQWALDAKALRPHVSLAGRVTQAPGLPTAPNVDWRMENFCLLRSDMSGHFPAYTVVDTWPLLDGAQKT